MRLFKLAAFCLIFLLLLPPPTACADDEESTVGLVLAGGGARGAAHVGVLRVLEELHIRPDFIAGTSMGAIVGGLYAAGLNADEIEEQLTGIDWNRVFTDDVGRAGHTMRRKQLDQDFLVKRRLGFNRGGLQTPLGALQGQHLDQALKRILGDAAGVQNFDRLPIPFRAVATDIATGEAVILGRGSLAQAIRASMSVPAVFAPVEIDGRLLVDGGLAMNTPVEVALAAGVDRVIVIDLSAPLLAQDEIDSVFKITEQMTTFLTRRNTEQSLSLLREGDVLLIPELDDFGSAQFDRVAEAIAAGEAAARASYAPIRALARQLPSRAPPEPQPLRTVTVAFVDLDNQSALNDHILWSRIRLKPGDELNLNRLEKDLGRLHALDVFDTVSYDLVSDESRGGTGVLITARPRHWGPNYLQFGMALTTDFESVNDFTLGAAYTRNAINRLGGDLRVIGSIGRRAGLAFDLYQPLDSRATWFVQPRVAWSRDRQDVFDGGANLGTVQLQNRGVSLGAGRNLGNRFQVRTDLERSQDRLEVIRGGLAGFSERENIGEWRVAALFDSLDNINFPNTGAQAELTWRRGLKALGADRSWEQLDLTTTAAFTHDRWTWLARGFGGLSLERDPPFSRAYRLGGFGQLSGLPPDALLGERAALLTLSTYRRIGRTRFFPIYAGVTAEAGNVWTRRRQMFISDLHARAASTHALLADDKSHSRSGLHARAASTQALLVDDKSHSRSGLRYAGAAFIGMDTVLGPMYLAYGRAQGGHDSFYFYLGNPFELRRR